MRYFKRSKGFSLPEVMVAIGISSLVVVAAMNLTQMIAKSQNQLNKNTQISFWTNQVGVALSDENSCKTTFVGNVTYSVPATPYVPSGAINAIYSGVGNPIISVNDKKSGVEITSISFRTKEDTGTDASGRITSFITVRIIFTATSAGVVSTQFKDIKFKASMEANNTTFYTCYADFSPSTFSETTCSYLGGLYNSITQICQIPDANTMPLDDQLIELDTDLTSLENEAISLGGRLTTAETEIVNLKTSIGNLQAEICAATATTDAGWESRLSTTMTSGCELLCNNVHRKFACQYLLGGSAVTVGASGCNVCRISTSNFSYCGNVGWARYGNASTMTSTPQVCAASTGICTCPGSTVQAKFHSWSNPGTVSPMSVSCQSTQTWTCNCCWQPAQYDAKGILISAATCLKDAKGVNLTYSGTSGNGGCPYTCTSCGACTGGTTKTSNSTTANVGCY